MREVWRIWRYSTMVVLTVLTAGLFAAILIPFKGIPLIPGVTELRPANVIPLMFGLLFGPAGAWGAAFGNLIGDFFGTLGPGSLFGFWGNFLAAYLPYQMWRGRPLEPLGSHWLRLILAALLGGTSCALVVGFGLASLRLLPFSIIAVAVFLNNVLVALALGPLLLKLLAPRVSRWDLYWQELMAPEDCRPGPAPRLGLMLAWVGGAGGYLLGLAVAAVLALRPQVIILDEPTTGLDHREQEDMLALIQDLHAQGHTVIMVTHSMWAASRYARRLIVLRAGRVVLDGPTRVVFAQEERLAACGLRPPEVVQLSRALGFMALTPEEFHRQIAAEVV